MYIVIYIYRYVFIQYTNYSIYDCMSTICTYIYIYTYICTYQYAYRCTYMCIYIIYRHMYDQSQIYPAENSWFNPRINNAIQVQDTQVHRESSHQGPPVEQQKGGIKTKNLRGILYFVGIFAGNIYTTVEPSSQVIVVISRIEFSRAKGQELSPPDHLLHLLLSGHIPLKK